MHKLVSLLLFSLLLYSCNSQECNTLPVQFKTYAEAISKVKSTNYRISDKIVTKHSSWITNASYYSCDGENGYLIYSTNKGNEYIHQGVPVAIWESLKTAPSLGSYLNKNIKHRYHLNLY